MIICNGDGTDWSTVLSVIQLAANHYANTSATRRKAKVKIRKSKAFTRSCSCYGNMFPSMVFSFDGKGKTKKAALDSILYKVKGTTLTNSIRGDPEVVSCL